MDWVSYPALQGPGYASPSQQNFKHRPPSLATLPGELIQFIIAYLSTASLKDVALASRILNHHASDALWRNVCLVDQRRQYIDGDLNAIRAERGHDHWCDDHDDTPIIQKLYILASNPSIASRVQYVTHRCHLPSPNIFTELPRMYFHAENLSQDPRLYALLHLAMQNLINVHTLRIVYGHWKFADALVKGFLQPGSRRTQPVPLRRLWLESCCLSDESLHSITIKMSTQLESIRIRRLRSAALASIETVGMGFLEYRPVRGGQFYQVHNGCGGWVDTTVQLSEEGLPERWPRTPISLLKIQGEAFDNAAWMDLYHVRGFIDANYVETDSHDLHLPPMEPIKCLLDCSSSTLTSLNLDWILWRRNAEDSSDNARETMLSLSRLRFPHLRAFQVRNAVLSLTRLPDDVFLLEDTFLGFLEAHSKIQCLAWPLDRFYNHSKSSLDIQTRIRKLIAHFATMIIDLRVDTQYAGNGEPLTDHGGVPEEQHDRIHRRRFITEFLPHMRKIEQLKIEGGIPRDEKREILRALHWCPLRKIVMIGVSFPAGNTWGAQGLQLKALDPGQGSELVYNLEEEDLNGILASYKRGLTSPENFVFEPAFGWPLGEAPLLQTIALHHAATVEELKICGYNGCPILSYPTPVTSPLLSNLRHFENLKQLVISIWLLTWYEESYRDTEIIQSWLNTRSPASTALTIVTPPTSPFTDFPVDPGHFPHFYNTTVPWFPPRQDFNRWAVTLKTRFSPSALAYRVARDIGPFLSSAAKSRSDGVRIRASFCLGAKEERRCANDIFDLDIRIGKDDQVLEFVGPREEGEKGRWWSKLESRRWF